MNEDDYRELLTEIQSGLRELGLDEIADPSAYRDLEGITYRASDLVVKMLTALERHMPLEDRRTYEKSMAILEEFRGEEPIPQPAIILTRDQAFLNGNPDQTEWSFTELPDLAGACNTLSNLIGEIRQDEDQ